MTNLRMRAIFAAGGLVLAGGAPRIDPAHASAGRMSVPPSISESGAARSPGISVTPRDDGDDSGDEGEGDDDGSEG